MRLDAIVDVAYIMEVASEPDPRLIFRTIQEAHISVPLSVTIKTHASTQRYDILLLITRVIKWEGDVVKFEAELSGNRIQGELNLATGKGSLRDRDTK